MRYDSLRHLQPSEAPDFTTKMSTGGVKQIKNQTFLNSVIVNSNTTIKDISVKQTRLF